MFVIAKSYVLGDVKIIKEILEQTRNLATYIYRKITKDPSNPNNYLVFQLLRGGKYHRTLASYNKKDLLSSLESLDKRRADGEFESLRIKVDGSLLDGESRYFRDIGELVDALKLKQGAEVGL